MALSCYLLTDLKPKKQSASSQAFAGLTPELSFTNLNSGAREKNLRTPDRSSKGINELPPKDGKVS